MIPGAHQILLVLLAFLLSLSVSSEMMGQSGANVQAGTMVMYNNSSEVTHPGEFHSGFYVGLNGRFGSYTWYLSPGAYYYRMDLLSSDELGFFASNERVTMIKIPIDMGARIIRNPVFNLRMYAGGVINYIESIDENKQQLTVDRYNDIHFGINAGVGVDLWWLTVDVKYEKGISGMLLNDSSTQADYISAGLGIFF